MNTLPALFDCIRLSFLKMLAYRLRYYTGVFTYLVYVSVYWFIWEAVYRGRGEIGGFNLNEMTTYVAVGWIARIFYFNDIDWEIHSRVRNGVISMDLLKPVDFQLMLFAISLGESFFRMVLFALPAGLLICTVYPVGGPVTWTAFLGFGLATFFALLINLGVNFLIGLLAFSMNSVLGIIRAKYIAIQLMSGLLVPLSFFPQSVERVLACTPFPYIAQTPLAVYLGKLEGTAVFKALLIQFSWVIILYILGRLFWQRCLRVLVIQGG